MKTIVKQLATGTFVIVFLLAGNIKADAAKNKALNIETTETIFQLGNWMTDEIVWNSSELSSADFIQETEADLQLEDWMTNYENWNINTIFTEQKETNLNLENWMINEHISKVNPCENEAGLTIERWMVDENFWK